MNTLLGAGNQTNGRALLGGVGGVDDAGGVGTSGSFGYVQAPTIEAFARVASSTSGSGGGGGLPPRGSGGGGLESFE